MSKEIQYSRISTKLQNLKAAHPQDVSMKLWKETFKGLINGGEAMRLFDVFAGTLMLLKARNKTYLAWADNANSDNWTAKWVENVFDKYDILSKYGPTTINGKMIHPRKPKEAMVVIEQAPVEAAHEQVFDCSHFSDELLLVAQKAINEELVRREEQKRQIAEIQELCELKGLTFEELYDKFQLVKSLMK